MRCLYCGKEYWLPAQVRRDPDFCCLAHREKYNHRFDLAMQRLQESPTAATPERAPAARTEMPAAQTPPGESRSAPPIPAAPPSPPPLPVSRLASPHAPPIFKPAPAPAATKPKSMLEQLKPQVKKPRWAVRPIFERLVAEHQASRTPVPERPAFTRTFTFPNPSAIRRSKSARHGIAALAASVAVALALWLGLHAGRLGTNLLNSAAARIAVSDPPSSDAARAPQVASPMPQPGPSVLRNPVAWVRSVAARRATTQVAESFDHGMADWDVDSQAWAPGWWRSPDGYVRPGRLALFQPSLRYSDYRMDFFGQIENKSMSWVVRGKDRQNYYVMKVNLVKRGLRPILSMAHYPVVEGRPGHRVEVPLSVIVHNNLPYHVSVQVQGSHYTASIEGQEIDSWSDDTLLAGGVGFFSDADALARIYWMKVSQNEDWLGWLCGRIAGSGDRGALTLLRMEPLQPFRGAGTRACRVEPSFDAPVLCDHIPSA